MAGTKISALEAIAALSADDILPVVDVTDVDMALSGTTKSVTTELLSDYIIAQNGTVEPVNVARFGRTKADVIAAMNEAEARGVATVVYFPSGAPYDLEDGLSLAGYTCQLQGDGVGGSTADPAGTVFHATSQNGPVLDYTGYLQPDSFKGRVSHGGFRVVGSGAADATKNNAGVRLFSMGSARFHDISVEQTGGPCWEHAGPLGSVYLNDFDRITLVTPVSANANDVPYAHMIASNGNRFRGWGLRSVTAGVDVGVSGAVIVTDDGTNCPHTNLFDAWWVEFLHVPTNGTILDIAGNDNTISDWQLFDTTAISGSTGTSVFRFQTPSVSNLGGNRLTGYIPGNGGTATSFDTGVDMLQSRNMVRGTKGYIGTNVTLASGVGFTDIELGGSEGAATTVAVVDNSGQTTNRYVDHYLKTEYTDGWRRDTSNVSGARGPRFLEAAGANGLVYLGSGGAYLRTVSSGLFVTSDTVQFRNTALTGAPTFTIGGSGGSFQIRTGTGSPESVVTAGVGSIFMRLDGGANTTLYVKESGSGATGWIAK